MRAFHLAVLLPMFIASVMKAQLPTVDITLVQVQADRYEVRLRPDLQFNGLFSSLVFTLRWSAGSAASLAEFSPTAAMQDIGIFPTISGDVVESGGARYATHVAFGFNSLASQGMAWNPGEEVVLGTLDVVGGPVAIELVNDGWTAANNGDFFISLNGSGQTGIIYALSTASEARPGMNAPFEVSIPAGARPVQVIINSDRPSVISYTITDASGRMVDQGNAHLAIGRNELVSRSMRPNAGAYIVRITTEAGTWTSSRHVILP